MWWGRVAKRGIIIWIQIVLILLYDKNLGFAQYEAFSLCHAQPISKPEDQIRGTEAVLKAVYIYLGKFHIQCQNTRLDCRVQLVLAFSLIPRNEFSKKCIKRIYSIWELEPHTTLHLLSPRAALLRSQPARFALRSKALKSLTTVFLAAPIFGWPPCR